MEVVAVLGNRLWLMLPLYLNPTVLRIMVLKSAMKLVMKLGEQQAAA